ncbi:LuxR family transcriptional regulator [Magnetospirillum sp. UT-4]|uniref:helix-turn-helix transcriptional regulator n=1 Tax=Magnetospirillum sp. UT-4 TaxID=2681467 RepID=UPI001385C2EF|nr:LuxR family transcriptional regulator [Magnetospirillum sp. UT-4]CAA7625724.1 putative transcriptional activator protein vanR [Magnetospirillum sp. UT-4]
MLLSAPLSELDSATTTDAVEDVAVRTVRNCGFGGYTYHLYRPGRGSLVYIGDWQAEWSQRYADQGYLDIDPVVERLLRSVTPFLWQDTVAQRPTGAPERVVLNEARDFGLKAGAEIPIHEHGFGVATFSVFSERESDFVKAWAEYKHNLHIFSLYFHEKYASLLPPDEELAPPALSRRERECLVWTSRGKTAWEVAEILHISERTVKLYLDAATRKLGSFSKHHAVVKAVLNRIILP